MKLSEAAIKKITTKAKNRIALLLNCSGYTVDRWIKDNEENGDLTKAKVVDIISEETKLVRTKILVEEPVKA